MSNHYKPNEFAELLNVSVTTLQRWDNNNKLKAFRSPTNRRYYTYEQYLEYKGINKKITIEKLSFSCKIYGLRKYKNKIREDKEVEKSIQNRN